MFILTHPANLSYGRKPERPKKTHDFRQSVDRLFSHESVATIEPTISEVSKIYKHQIILMWLHSEHVLPRYDLTMLNSAVSSVQHQIILR